MAVTTQWTMPEVLESQAEASADLVLVSSAPLACRGLPQQSAWVLPALERIAFAADPGQALDLLPRHEGAPRLLVLGIGAGTSRAHDHWLSMGGFLIEAMRKNRLATVRLPGGAALGGADVLEMILLGALLHGFELDKGSQTAKKAFTLHGLIVAAEDRICADAARRCADAVNSARAWVERPANLLTPLVWAEEAREVFSRRNAHVRILGPMELQAMGAGALLAVGRGSEHGAQLLVVEWRGSVSRDGWDAVIVGKGLTFDAGGLNLKPRPNISKMKLDMAGGAAVLGALELAIAREARVNIVAIVPMVENTIDALGFRPGDVVTSLSGLTVEVADTDAEGRLALADAITYGIQNYQPAWLVDAATLTTAVSGVLHEEFAAVYASDDRLARELVRAGEATGERLWRLPLDPSQDYLVESAVADVANVGAPGYFDRGAGSPTAGAKFLQRFSQNVRWAHIDMCGTAWSTRRTARSGIGATGFGVRLLDRWLAAIEV